MRTQLLLAVQPSCHLHAVTCAHAPCACADLTCCSLCCTVCHADGGKVGRNILQQTSSWFKRSKSSASVSAGAAPGSRPSFLAPSKTGLPHSQSAVAGSSPPSTTAAAWFPASADGSRASAATGGADSSAQQVAPDDTAADGGHVQRSSSGKLGAAGPGSEPGTPRSLKHSLSGSSNASGSGSGSGSGQRAVPVAPNPHVGALAAEQAIEQAIGNIQEAAAEAVQKAEEAAGDTVSSLADTLSHSPVSLADPVSLLKQATQHKRNSSVDAEAVMAALEENGFHATDAYMGAFFYTRISLVGTGDAGSSAGSGGPSSSYCSKVVALTLAGEASWDQGFWLPLVRPAPPAAALELELYAAKDDK